MKRSSIGWVEIIIGVLMIILGVYTMLNPIDSIYAIVFAYAIMAVVSGIADIVIYFRLERRAGLGSAMMIIAGILNILVGVLLFALPGLGVTTISIMFPIWFIAHSIARLANLDYVKRYASSLEYWLLLIANVLGIVMGILLLFNPLWSATALVYFVAWYFLVEGFAGVIAGFGNVGATR